MLKMDPIWIHFYFFISVCRKNREKLFSGGGGGKKTPKTTPNAAKSPKAGKVGKKSTTWDPVMFGGEGGSGASKSEVASLDRTRDKPTDGAVPTVSFSLNCMFGGKEGIGTNKSEAASLDRTRDKPTDGAVPTVSC